MGKSLNGEGYCEKLPDGRYKAVVSVIIDNERKRFTATCPKKADALTKAKNKAKQYRKSILINTTSPKKELQKTYKESFTDYWEDYKKTRSLSSSTIINNEKMIYSCIFGNCVNNPNIKLQDININFFNDIIDVINERYSYQVAKKLRGHIKRHYKYLVKKSIFMEDLWDNVNPITINKQKQEYEAGEFDQLKDEVEIFTDEEIIKMRDYCSQLLFFNADDKEHVKRRQRNLMQDCRMFYIMALTGMRGAEIRALTTDDVDLDNFTIDINKALSIKEGKQTPVLIVKEPKTKKSRRTIGINSSTRDILEQAIANRKNKDEDDKMSKIIFQDEKGSFLTYDTFQYRFERLLKELDIEKGNRSSHSFRHTFISLSIDNNPISPLHNKSIIFISRYVGHDKLSTTLDVYTHISKNRITKIDDDISVIDKEIEFK